MIPRTKATIALGITLSCLSGCAANPYDRDGHPSGYNSADVDRDSMECEYKARLADEQHFYSQSSPFPFNSGPQSPADHARALHGLSTINAMRNTCLAAKGYRMEYRDACAGFA
jgi:hypothetical protein